MKVFILFLFFSLVVAAQVKNYNFSPVPYVEMLFGLNYTESSIEVLVESNGCTNKDSFHVIKDYESEDQIVRLLFIRYKPDWCKSYIGEGVRLLFSREELGIGATDLIRVENPFGPNPRQGQ